MLIPVKTKGTLHMERDNENGKYYLFFRDKNFQNFAIKPNSDGLTALSQGESDAAIKYVSKGYSRAWAYHLWTETIKRHEDIF